MMTNSNFRYYARTSGVEIWELYRCPMGSTPLLKQPLSVIQKANSSHAWLAVENIQGLLEENLTGWFDENNLVSVEKAGLILSGWKLPLN